MNSQYNAQGVTFNNPSALDYSKGSNSIPNFAHSGTVAVEPCVGVEFCKSPVTVTFTAAQTSVRVWVGESLPLAEPLGVLLTALDAGTKPVGTAEATLPANAGPTSIQAPLGVELPQAVIMSVEVSVTTGGGYSGGLALDDLEFSTVGPPPPCSATGPPSIGLDLPQSGRSVQNNEFLLRGVVNNSGAPITSASVIAQSPTSRAASIFPALIGPGGGPFGAVRFNGLLSPGDNEVSVTATNCSGTGTSNTTMVTWNPIPAGTKFRQLGMIEVSQGVQDYNNTVPLIAASPNGAKRTFARVYLGVEGATTSLSRVTGTLTAVRPDGSRPGGPLSIQSREPILVFSGSTLEGDRSYIEGSLNFELPPEWLAAGRLHLQLGQLEIEGTPTALPCTGCDNPGPTGPAFVNFHTVPPLRITLVGVPYLPTPEATAANSPRAIDFEMLESWLRRAYPSANVQVAQMTLPVQPGPPGQEDEEGNIIRPGFFCDDVNDQLSDFVATLPAQNPRTRFYGLVSDSGGNFMRGCSEIGGQFGSGPAGKGAFAWDTDASYADWYGGHEIGHLFGRLHPGYCKKNSHDDSHFPYLGGLIGSAVFPVQGLDTGNAALGIPLKLMDRSEGWTDVMTYCDKEWMSDYTYRGILQNLCGGDHPNCPDFALLSGVKRRGPALSVNGSLSLRSGRLSLSPLWARAGLKLSARPRRSAYAIVLRGAGGRILARYPFTPSVLSDLSPRRAEALVNEVVPFQPATRRVVITKGKRTLATVRVSAQAPTVRLLSPNGHKKLRKSVTLRWRSQDADGGRHWYTVLYSPNGRRTIPIAAALRKHSLRVDLRKLPGGSHAHFQVIASDGVRTGSDRSDPLRVPAKKPRVLVTTPQDGTQIVAGQQITLEASVTDLQDIPLPASRVVWRSSIQGELGHGLAITTALAAGTHEITVTATNRAGKRTKATVTVTAQAVPPVVFANSGP